MDDIIEKIITINCGDDVDVDVDVDLDLDLDLEVNVKVKVYVDFAADVGGDVEDRSFKDITLWTRLVGLGIAKTRTN